MQPLPQPSEVASRSFWNGSFAAWYLDHAYTHDSKGYPFYELRHQAVLRVLADRKPGIFFEVGFGKGAMIAALLDAGWRGGGCDFGVKQHAYAQERLGARRGLELGLLLEGVNALSSLGRESLDLVVCLGPLEYLNENEAKWAFREMRRVLRTGGLVVTAHANMLPDLLSMDVFTVEAFSTIMSRLHATGKSSFGDVDFRTAVARRFSPTSLLDSKSIRTQVGTRSENPLWVADDLLSYGFKLEAIRYNRLIDLPPFLERSLNLAQTVGTAWDSEEAVNLTQYAPWVCSGFVTFSTTIELEVVS